jgi:NAD(P)-dependent dehydrogenase (short-subunit alcohol dehydrogenase family)
MPAPLPSKAQIVVTGGSRGIGAAIVAELARRGRAVVSLSRSGAAPAGRGVVCDVTDEAAVRAALAAIARDAPIGGLVNNAGLHIATAAAALPTAELEQVLRVNATAVFVLAREAHPHLRAHGGGLIVNIGSFFDKMGVPNHLAYCASKAAVGAVTRCLAVEWAADGIAVLNVAPGYIATDLNVDFLAQEKTQRWVRQRIPVGRVGQPEEVARLVACLFDESIPFLTGETLYLDGGQGMNH